MTLRPHKGLRVGLWGLIGLIGLMGLIGLIGLMGLIGLISLTGEPLGSPPLGRGRGWASNIAMNKDAHSRTAESRPPAESWQCGIHLLSVSRGASYSEFKA